MVIVLGGLGCLHIGNFMNLYTLAKVIIFKGGKIFLNRLLSTMLYQSFFSLPSCLFSFGGSRHWVMTFFFSCLLSQYIVKSIMLLLYEAASTRNGRLFFLVLVVHEWVLILLMLSVMNLQYFSAIFFKCCTLNRVKFDALTFRKECLFFFFVCQGL